MTDEDLDLEEPILEELEFPELEEVTAPELPPPTPELGTEPTLPEPKPEQPKKTIKISGTVMLIIIFALIIGGGFGAAYFLGFFGGPQCPELSECNDGNPCTADLCSEMSNYTCYHLNLNGSQGNCTGNATGYCKINSCVNGTCSIINEPGCVVCDNDGECERNEGETPAGCADCIESVCDDVIDNDGDDYIDCDDSDCATDPYCTVECHEGDDPKPCMTVLNCAGVQSCKDGKWGLCTDLPSDGCPAFECEPGQTISCLTSLNCPGFRNCSYDKEWGECLDVETDACP